MAVGAGVVAPPSAPPTWRYRQRTPVVGGQVQLQQPVHGQTERERERERDHERDHERDREDVDELDDDAGSSEADVEVEGEGGVVAGVRGGVGNGAYARKRVSVDMLIAETLGEGGGGGKGQSGGVVHNGDPRYAYGAGSPPSEAKAANTNVGGGGAQGTGTGAGAWYAETEGAGVGSGMGVIDVGSEGDKKKRLNRQSANYGSKAVACVHCRGEWLCVCFAYHV